MAQTFTTKDCIQRFIAIHSERYDYSNVQYYNKCTPVEIICPVHGAFLQTPETHWSGHGCPQCGLLSTRRAKQKSQNEFINEARQKHGDKYDYSNTVYTGTYNKVTIQCPTHGDFQIRANSHLNGQGCPQCGKENRVLSYRKSLHKTVASEYEHLLQYWSPQNNCRPEQVGYKSKTKYYWICASCGKAFQQSISKISATQHAVPICNKCHTHGCIPGVNDLQSTYPILCKQWNYDKNTLSPNQVAFGSALAIWWKCEAGHQFQMSCALRTHHAHPEECPVCSCKLILPGLNDIRTLFPQIANELSPMNNIDASTLSPRSTKRVLWKCSFCGHEWKASCYMRTQKHTGCPECAKLFKTSTPETILYFYIRQHFPDAIQSYRPTWLKHSEIDIYIPSLHVGVEYDGVAFHKQRAQADFLKTQLCTNHAIKIIRIRESGLADVPGCCNLVAHQQKKNDYQYMQAVVQQCLEQLGVPKCVVDIVHDIDKIRDIRREQLRGMSLAIKYPQLLKYWDFNRNTVNPDAVSISSRKKVWIFDTTGKSTLTPAYMLRKYL